ncbi:hypothetical protein ACM26V_24645 [Salipaludibacillus sp. HK11]|uniref:hypothetical protein n=1 Tax=Salipaludibacillus sp. HK11 TaxID=3394320 RepID=UPI0039FB99EA
MNTAEMKTWQDRLNSIAKAEGTVKVDRLANFQSDLSNIYGRLDCIDDPFAQKLYDVAEELY